MYALFVLCFVFFLSAGIESSVRVDNRGTRSTTNINNYTARNMQISHDGGANRMTINENSAGNDPVNGEPSELVQYVVEETAGAEEQEQGSMGKVPNGAPSEMPSAQLEKPEHQAGVSPEAEKLNPLSELPPNKTDNVEDAQAGLMEEYQRLLQTPRQLENHPVGDEDEGECTGRKYLGSEEDTPRKPYAAEDHPSPVAACQPDDQLGTLIQNITFDEGAEDVNDSNINTSSLLSSELTSESILSDASTNTVIRRPTNDIQNNLDRSPTNKCSKELNIPGDSPSTNVEPHLPGQSDSRKLVLSIGIGLLAVGFAIWFMVKRPK